MIRFTRVLVILSALLCALLVGTDGFGYAHVAAQTPRATQVPTEVIPVFQAQGEVIQAESSGQLPLIIGMGFMLLLLAALYLMKEYKETQQYKQLIEVSKTAVENARDMVPEPVAKNLIQMGRDLYREGNERADSFVASTATDVDDRLLAYTRQHMEKTGREILADLGITIPATEPNPAGIFPRSAITDAERVAAGETDDAIFKAQPADG